MMGKTTYKMVDNLNNLNNERTAQLISVCKAEHGAWSTWASVYAGLIKDFIPLEYNTPDKKKPLARNVDATIAGAEAVGYQFTNHFQAGSFNHVRLGRKYFGSSRITTNCNL